MGCEKSWRTTLLCGNRSSTRRRSRRRIRRRGRARATAASSANGRRGATSPEQRSALRTLRIACDPVVDVLGAVPVVVAVRIGRRAHVLILGGILRMLQDVRRWRAPTVSGLDERGGETAGDGAHQPEPGELGASMMASLAAMNEFLAGTRPSAGMVTTSSCTAVRTSKSAGRGVGHLRGCERCGPVGVSAGTAARGVPWRLCRPGQGGALRWSCTEHGHTPTGVTWEVYGDWADDSAERRTDVYAQIGPSVRPARPAPLPLPLKQARRRYRSRSNPTKASMPR